MRAPERLGPYVYRQSDTCFPLGATAWPWPPLPRCGGGPGVRSGLRGGGAAPAVSRPGFPTGPLRCGILPGGRRPGPPEPVGKRPGGGDLHRRPPRRVQNPPRRGAFSLAISNPPYFKAGSGGCGGPARMEGDCALEDWCAAAGRLLKNGGRFALVHRPERLCDLFAALRSAGLEPKRLRLLQHGPDCPPSAVLLEAVRQGRPGLEILPTLLSNRR